MPPAPTCSALWAGWTNPQCWYDWQTLIAGCLALLAAFGTIWVMSCQIRQAGRHEKVRLEREHRAERILVGFVFSDLMVACRGSMQGSLFSPPEDIAKRLQEFLATTDDHELIGIVSQLGREIRVRQARQSGVTRTLSSRPTPEEICDLAEIHTLAEFLLRYCDPAEVVTAPYVIGWDRVREALGLIDIRQTDNPDVFARLDSRIGERKKFWPRP